MVSLSSFRWSMLSLAVLWFGLVGSSADAFQDDGKGKPDQPGAKKDGEQSDDKKNEKADPDKEEKDEGIGGSKFEVEEEKINPSTDFYKRLTSESVKLYTETLQKDAAVAKAKTPEEKQKAQQELRETSRKTSDSLEQALADANPDVDFAKWINTARAMLARMYLFQQRHYETAVLAFYTSRQLPDDSNDALGTALVAQAAILSEYKEQKQAGAEVRFEERQLVEIANYIVQRFGSTTQSNNSRVILASLYRSKDRLEDAVAQFADVPKGTALFDQARSQAGQISWMLYNRPEAISDLPDDEQAAGKRLDALRTQARSYLEEAIEVQLADAEQQQGKLSAEQRKRLMENRYALAQIQNSLQQYEDAIKTLTEGEFNPVQLNSVKDNQKRPKEGLQSALWGGRIYQLLLQAYAGKNDIEKARETIGKLKEIADKPEFLMAIYTQLGRRLGDEMERVDDPEKKEQLRQSFEIILTDIVSQQGAEPDLSTLLWVSTTFAAFAKSADDKEVASKFTEKANGVYQKILDRAQSTQNFLSTAQQAGIRLEMARLQTEAGNFDEAQELLQNILAANPNTLAAQFEAAELLEKRADRTGDEELYLQAIQGTTWGNAKVWGWEEIAQKLYRLLTSGNVSRSKTLFGWGDILKGSRPKRRRISQTEQNDRLDQYREQHLQAWYHAASARFEYSKLLKGDDQQRQAENARLQLTTLAQLIADVPTEWRERYNKLNSDIQEFLAVPDPEPLFRDSLDTTAALSGSE